MRGPYRKRQIESPPRYTNFKPSGIPKSLLNQIELPLGEYEAIRLADYENLDHREAAEKMNISRPTFSRLIEKARNSVARAIIDGSELVIQGGYFELANTLHRCKDCGGYLLRPMKVKNIDCVDCGSSNIEDLPQPFIAKTGNRKKIERKRFRQGRASKNNGSSNK